MDDWVDPDPVPLSDGTRLAVRLLPGGDGPPVLLVHGLASNALLWRDVATKLSAGGFPVAVVDLRAHGRSDRPAHGHSTAQAARDLSEVAAGLGWTQRETVLAGQSWGGNVVLRAAASDLWGAVLAVDGGWIHLRRRFRTFEQCWAELAPPDFGPSTPEAVQERIGSMVSGWPPRALTAILGSLEVVDGRVRNRLAAEHHRAILYSLWRDDPASSYPEVQSPVHLMVAGREASGEVAAAAEALPDATVSWHPGAHHDIHLQHPEVVAARLHDLVARMQGSQS